MSQKADPQLEDGYTRLANELLEAILGFGFTGRQLLVVFAVIRKTYGYGKKQDDMSAAQIGQICGMARSHVTDVIGQLVELRVITKSPGSYGMVVGINKRYDQWGSAKPDQEKPVCESKKGPFHYTYKVTHKETGEFYIGVRTSNCTPNQDRYKGSGGWIAMVDFNDLLKEVTGHYASREEAEQAEKELIRKAHGDRKLRNKTLYLTSTDYVQGVQIVCSGSTESVHVDSTKSVHTKENLSKENQKKSPRQEVTFKVWIASCEEQGVKPIPEDDPVFDYATAVKIPLEFIRLTWVEFKRKYATSTKRYKAWNQHFGNAVRENWYGIWFEKDNEWQLSTRGKQIQKELNSKGK
jgi:phage replication O-like protein O